MLNIILLKNFISKEDCKYLINFAENSNLWGGSGNKFWENRIIDYRDVITNDKVAASIMLNANIRCAQKIKENYNLKNKIFSDTLQIIRWFPGMEQPPHADDMSNTEVKGFSHREFGSIIYLNDNYRGGHTFYPNFNFEITPESGSLAIHPGDSEHLHGVTKIEEAVRYTIASFWTSDRSKSNDWSLY